MTATIHNLTTYRLKKQAEYNQVDFGTFTQDWTGVEKALIKLAIVEDKSLVFFEQHIEGGR